MLISSIIPTMYKYLMYSLFLLMENSLSYSFDNAMFVPRNCAKVTLFCNGQSYLDLDLFPIITMPGSILYAPNKL